MRVRTAPILPALLLPALLLIGGPADAARRGKRGTPSVPTAQVLRAPARATAAPFARAAPLGGAASPFAAAPQTRLPRLADVGAAGMAGLRSTGDAAPVCRADCARRRYACGSGEDDSATCVPVWSQCVLACRGVR